LRTLRSSLRATSTSWRRSLRRLTPSSTPRSAVSTVPTRWRYARSAPLVAVKAARWYAEPDIIGVESLTTNAPEAAIRLPRGLFCVYGVTTPGLVGRLYRAGLWPATRGPVPVHDIHVRSPLPPDLVSKRWVVD